MGVFITDKTILKFPQKINI